MRLNEGQRDKGRRGLAAARRAGKLGSEDAPLEVKLPFLESDDPPPVRSETLTKELLDQARELTDLTDHQLSERTELTRDLIAEIDAGRFAVTLEELINELRKLGLTVKVERLPVDATPRVSLAPTPESSPSAETTPRARLPYRDD